MAYVARTQVSAPVGLYDAIVAAVEANFEAWEAKPRPRHYLTGELLPDPYPFQRQLDAVRAGASVNVDVSQLPEGVRRTREGQRVIVRPDDTVSFGDDGGLELWMEESGLLYGLGHGHSHERWRL